MSQTLSREERSTLTKVIAASSAGTLIEWYDFYIFGALATILAGHFFPKENPTAALLSTLATFATGFLVRPFGAVVFGKMGDLMGRKHTFMLTLLMMGFSTCAIGLLPTYSQIGFLAPVLLLVLRLIQGLALGGEYGGAAIYVAEHSPDRRRGFFTSFIQTTATLGLFVSLGVILVSRNSLGEADFAAWGWRVPFLLSLVLVIFSYFIRRRMNESPLFTEMKAKGRQSEHPIRDSFMVPENRRLVLLALLGATMGQGVVWYTGQFYALYYLQTVMLVDLAAASKIVSAALVLGTPFFIVFGALSDRLGRKRVMMAGCLLACLAYVPIYQQMQAALPVKDLGRPTMQSSVAVSPDGKTAKRTEIGTLSNGVHIKVVTPVTPDPPHAPLPKEKPKTSYDPTSGQFWTLVGLVFVQVLFVTMVYGPIAAFLVELFPTRVRYTSLSLPYHIGNGVFGGLVPLIGTALVDRTGNVYAGLWYPCIVAAITFLIGAWLLPERTGTSLGDASVDAV